MILVVADTSPLRYLVETAYEFLLPRLFTKVWIPGTVTAELRHARSPAVVREWAGSSPYGLRYGKSKAFRCARIGGPGSRRMGGD